MYIVLWQAICDSVDKQGVTPMFTEITVFFATTANNIAAFFANNAYFVAYNVAALLLAVSIIVGIEIAKRRKV